MMEVAGETCKLCLKYIQGDNLAALDEKLLGKLEFLQMDLDQSVEESNSLCKECEEKIEKAFDFKSCVVNIDASGSEDPKQDVSDIPSTSTGESSAEKTMCHLCKNSVDKISVISLPKLLKDDSMMEVFQGHIPEVDLKETENSMVCESCQKSLASFSTLVASWSIANDWNEDEDMKDMDDFEMVQVKKENFDELSDSNTNSSCAIEVSDSVKTSKKGKGKKKVPSSTKVKNEIHEISDSSESASTSKDIKKEETEEAEDAEMEDLQLKNEEVDIKDEDGLKSRRSCNAGSRKGSIISPDANNKTVGKFKCAYCGFKAKFLKVLLKHIKDRHKGKSIAGNYEEATIQIKKLENENEEIILYQCHVCTFETKRTSHLTRHYLRHKNENELTMYKCAQCTFKTKHKISLKGHLECHKSKDERILHRCPYCSFGSPNRSKYQKHSLIHKSENEVVIYKCELCLYQAKDKEYMLKHLVRHKTEEEVTMFKCQLCPFQTKYKRNLNCHNMKHKKKNELFMHKCELCPFETKYKSNLIGHMLSHKTKEDISNCDEGNEILMLKCDLCSFETKYKSSIRGHMLSHRSKQDNSTFKCDHCDYQTNWKTSFKRHCLRHNVQIN